MENMDDLFSFVGLTKYESSALKSLFYLQEATVEEISKNAKVPLPKLYQVLKKLENTSFVSASVGRPVKYRPVPPDVSFANYFESQRRNLKKLEKTLDSISKQFSEVGNPPIEQTQILKTRSFVLNFLTAHLQENTTKSYFACVAFHSSQTPLMPILKKKIAKDFECRIIGVIAESNQYIAEKYKALGAKVKILDTAVSPFRFALFDNQHVSATILDEYNEYVTIWSNSKETVHTFSDLFNHYWSTGKDL